MFWASVSWFCFKLPFCPFGHTNDTTVTYEKAKCVCFNDMQQQKVKFTFVQINMKQVSYSPTTDKDYNRFYSLMVILLAKLN